MRRMGLVLATLALGACRVESVAPGGGGPVTGSSEPSGDLWIYTSMYRPVIDAFEPLLRRSLPHVNVHWYQAGSEKVTNRLEAELAAGGTQADILLISDPFLYERLKDQGALLRYVSPNSLRTPRALMDLDGHYAACRISTMVLAYRSDVTVPPRSFRELTEPRWKGEVAIGDALTSGTAFTWALAMARSYGDDYFKALRENGALVAGGNAAVQQKLESGEAKVGVLLLENALLAKAKGSALSFVYPSDGAVIVPGPIALFASTRNPTAAKAFADLLLSPEGQRQLVEVGDLQAVDPRVPGPRMEPGIEKLLTLAQPWDEAFVRRGVEHGAELKTKFSGAFQR